MLQTPDAIKLEVIRHIESRNCENINHKSDAIGCYGLRPNTIKQLGYELKLHKLKTQPKNKLHNTIALQNLNYIKKISSCNSEECLAYGWLNGAFGLKKILKKYNYGKIPYRNPLEDHWYVKRYNKTKSKLSFNQELIVVPEITF